MASYLSLQLEVSQAQLLIINWLYLTGANLLGDTVVDHTLSHCVAGQMRLGQSNDNMEQVVRERGGGWGEEKVKSKMLYLTVSPAKHT